MHSKNLSSYIQVWWCEMQVTSLELSRELEAVQQGKAPPLAKAKHMLPPRAGVPLSGYCRVIPQLPWSEQERSRLLP